MLSFDYCMGYNVIPYSQIMEYIKLFGIAPNFERLLAKNSTFGEVKDGTNIICRSLGTVKISGGTFEGDCLSTPMFVLCMIPLTYLPCYSNATNEILIKFYTCMTSKFTVKMNPMSVLSLVRL